MNKSLNDVKKDTILLWKSKTIPNAYDLKINERKVIGLLRTDKNGEIYWKFHDLLVKSPKVLK